MTAVYFPGIVTIVPQYNINAPSAAANVLHWEGSLTSYSTTQLTAIQSAFNSAWQSAYHPLLCANDFYIGCIVIDSGSASGLQVTNASYSPIGGGAGTPCISDNSAILLSLHQALRYKGGHGRLYLPGIGSGVANPDGRTIPPSTVTIVNTLWTNTVAAMAGVPSGDGGPLSPVIWHKKLSSAPNTTQPVISVTPQLVLASQRRRLRKVSRHHTRVIPV